MVLLKLLEHPGELVTREQLRTALWPADTFVDFDTGLNTVIKRLREVLRDSAEGPHVIETVPKLGYRFIAPVQVVGDQQPAGIPPRKSARISGWIKWTGAATVLLAAFAMTVLTIQIERQSRTTVEVALTGSGLRWRTLRPFRLTAIRWFSNLQRSTRRERRTYTTMIGGEKPLRLTSNPDDCCPAWSPDARRLPSLVATQEGARSMSCLPRGTPKEIYSRRWFKEHIGMLPFFSWFQMADTWRSALSLRPKNGPPSLSSHCRIPPGGR